MSRYIDADELIMALRLEYPMMPIFKELREEWDIKTEGYRKAEEVIRNAPTIEPNLILPERMERGDIYEVGETIVVMNHDDYYDLLCKSWVPKHGEWIYVTVEEKLKTGRGYGHHCSECDEINKSGPSNFCPNCGADMRGGHNE